MLNDINMRDIIGISAGAINAVGYHEGIIERIEKRLYYRYPKFLNSLMISNQRYNGLCDILYQLEKQGIIYVIASSQQVTVSRTEKDLEKLGDLYELGRKDVKNQLNQIQAYLKTSV